MSVSYQQGVMAEVVLADIPDILGTDHKDQIQCQLHCLE
jgi:hypothetical protein